MSDYAGRIYRAPRNRKHPESPWHREILAVEDGRSGVVRCLMVRYRALCHDGAVRECPIGVWRQWVRRAEREK